MLERLFENIGGKIKFLAKLGFVAGSVASVIAGFVLMLINIDVILFGIALLICGPVISLLASWFLYAFGELVEKTADNEDNSRTIVELLKEKDENKTSTAKSSARFVQPKKEPVVNSNNNNDNNNIKTNRNTKVAEYSLSEKNTIICSSCNFEQPSSRKVCWHCGAEFKEKTE